jgi:ankyrin repeat protein
LEVLRDCLPSSVRRSLRELPESLDETYERILKEIKKPNKAHARRVLQCLVVATRPLRVDELAEVLAVDFDDAEGIPRLKPEWRWEDQELALLSACSSLIAIVQARNSRVVQFSHFSVKEFLTSSRLRTASGEVKAYHIDLEPAHMILGQACLGVLLQIQDDIEDNTRGDHPLARYAARHWTTHARFGEVSSRLQKGMKYVFDPGKPHFRVWLALYDIDSPTSEGAIFYKFTPLHKSAGAPLYYAALCGFHDLVEHLITRYSQDVNADGGYYMRPLVAALAGEHFQTAELLRHNGADMHVRGFDETTPLHSAAYYKNLKMVQKLIDYEADIHAEDKDGWTPLYWASTGHHFKDDSVLRLLLEHGADVNARAKDGRIPLHEASERGALEAVRLLLEHGADVNARAKDGRIPLHEASVRGALEVVRLLLEHGADVEAKDNDGKTPLQAVAGRRRREEVVKLLREHGAK